MRAFLTKSSTLWWLFALFIAQSVAFGLVMWIWGFTVIDEISHPGAVREHIDSMSALQRSVHAWMTATLDVAYPLTYGSLFAGLALRSLPSGFALPALICVPVDLVEGGVQVLALSGTYDALWLKAYVTPLKLALFFGAIVIAIYALVRWLRRPREG